LLFSEIIIQGYTSRPQKFVIRRLVNPAGEDRVFHPDELHDHSFDGFGLYWEADAVARCLRGEPGTQNSAGTDEA
jgi:hypothetical protein